MEIDLYDERLADLARALRLEKANVLSSYDHHTIEQSSWPTFLPDAHIVLKAGKASLMHPTTVS